MSITECKTADDVRKVAAKVRLFRQSLRLARGQSLRTEGVILPRLAGAENVIHGAFPVSNPSKVFRETPTQSEILRTVSAFYNISTIAIRSGQQTKGMCRVRHIAMYLMRELTFLSFTQIGRAFNNRHHTTVLSGANKIERLAETDERLRDELDLLKIKIAELMAANMATP